MSQPALDDAPSSQRTSGYHVVAASLAQDREAILRLWKTGLANGEMQEAKLRWYYERNPAGTPQTYLLKPDGASQAVGVATLGRRLMRLGTQVVIAGLLVDFVVEPDHRGFFPALFLQKELGRRAAEAHALVFGMPNPRSEAIVRRAGYRCVGQLARWVRVLRSGDYLSRLLPNWIGAPLGAIIDRVRMATASLGARGESEYRWEWRGRPDASFDSLWERVAGSGVLIGVRDRAFLEWRFAESPFHTYRFFAVTSKADGRLVAYTVCHVLDQSLHVSDFLVDPGAAGAGKRLWLELAREAYRRGHRSLSVAFLGDPGALRDLEALGVVNREQRPLYAAIGARQDLGRVAWYVTNADEDG